MRQSILRIPIALGSIKSIVIHTILIGFSFGLIFFGVSIDTVLLIVTTILTIEAIYLSLFLQLSMNDQIKDIDEIMKDTEELVDDVNEIRTDTEEIVEDVNEIRTDTEEIVDEVSEILEDTDSITQTKRTINTLSNEETLLEVLERIEKELQVIKKSISKE